MSTVTCLVTLLLLDNINYLYFSCPFACYFLYVHIEGSLFYDNEKSESYKKNGMPLHIDYGIGYTRGFMSEDVVEVSK